MIAHTKAFDRYREATQAHLDFAVLVCHAVPALNAALDGGAAVPRPDSFQGGSSTAPALRRYATRYEAQLASTMLITIYSYFEEYVRALLAEVFEFQGGLEPFIQLSERRARTFLRAANPRIAESRRKLQEPPKSAKVEKYQKHTRILQAEAYRFPTELLAPYGARMLAKKTAETSGFRAWEIPDLFEHALLFPLAQTERERLDEIRRRRNKVAHGTGAALTMRYSSKAATDLHALAAKIDQHVAMHFLVVEKFT